MSTEKFWDELTDTVVKQTISAIAGKVVGLILNIISSDLQDVDRKLRGIIDAPFKQAQTTLEQAEVAPSIERKNYLYDQARYLFVKAGSQLEEISWLESAKSFQLAGTCCELSGHKEESYVLYRKALNIAQKVRDNLQSTNDSARTGRVIRESGKTAGALGFLASGGYIAGAIYPPLSLPLVLVGGAILGTIDWKSVPEGKELPEAKKMVSRLETLLYRSP